MRESGRESKKGRERGGEREESKTESVERGNKEREERRKWAVLGSDLAVVITGGDQVLSLYEGPPLTIGGMAAFGSAHIRVVFYLPKVVKYLTLR